MRRVSSLLFLAAVAAFIYAPPAAAGCGVAGSCAGGYVYNCEREYNHLRNWDFESDCEWTYTPSTWTNLGAFRSLDQNMCGGGVMASLGYGKLVPPNSGNTSKIHQNLTPVYPAGFGDSWIVGYHLEFNDPYLSYDNTVRVRVYNASTGALIAQGPLHRGSQGDPECYRYSFTFTAALHNVPVRFEVYAVWNGPFTGGTFAAVDNLVMANAKVTP